ncbi:MAG: hypothetical protein COU29_00220 [Candidatus Magasanikbacteria bacterium CG10_big_fil_rev_8_21_14_0_10_36_32]|uniref:Uncharacterized protein n=1 Tax=Candidatus Magasanikbacteria bacterium CG10_big_fil_rev_8_21_14_0_10_36_32 TaxID=1974646 RepID=A0A2M6W7M7_9BACT|nr:MAG: hypothetical protein COU29_00220 [Candidatus Magasanikbacteria bacterium CG10_big_fil_rev_8_21_14_0_10_36_32]
MKSVKRKLFISLEGLIEKVSRMPVNMETAADLRTGLFCLGCTRDDVREAVAQLASEGKSYPAAMISDAIFMANLHGRIRWVLATEIPAFYHLNFLLVDSGFKSLRPVLYHNYTAEEIIRLMAETNPELEVIP